MIARDQEEGKCSVPLCDRGTVMYFDADGEPQFKDCECAAPRKLLEAMDPEVSAVTPLEGHSAFLRDKKLVPGFAASKRAVLRGSRTDFLCLAQRFTVDALVASEGRSSGFELISDQRVLDWHQKYRLDPEANSNPDELANASEHLFVWLGALRNGWDNTCSLIADVLRLRDARSGTTWLGFDPAAPLWLKESDGWPALEAYVSGSFSMVEIPRIAEVSDEGLSFFDLATPTASKASTTRPSSNAGTALQKASAPGRCTNCGAVIARGDEFAWADAVGLSERKGQKACRSCAGQ